MPERIQKPKPQPQEHAPQEPHAQPTAERDPEAQAKIDYTDDLLDEIDGVLEENAEEFVRGYVQKGGQ